MNKLILFAVIIALTLAQNPKRGAIKSPSPSTAPKYTVPVSPADQDSTSTLGGFLGDMSLPFIEGLTNMASSLATEFAQNPCVTKVTTQIQSDIIGCVFDFHANHKFMDAINCVGKIRTNAKAVLKKECDISWDE